MMLKQKKFALAAAIAITMTVSIPQQTMAVSQNIITTPIQNISTVPIVADATLYRGTVTSIAHDNGIYTFTLAQAKGTNYGTPELTFQAGNDTVFGCLPSEIVEGDYLEVAYGGSGTLETQNALTVKKLVEASMSVYNGEFVSYNDSSLLLRNPTTKQEIIFLYTDSTSTNLDLTKLTSGEMLSVYFSGVTTRSLPPQATALEISNYDHSEIYRGTITSKTEKNGTTTMTLKRATGTDFSTDTKTFEINNTTLLSDKLAVFNTGNYIEAFIGKTDNHFLASSVKKLTVPEICIYNGVLSRVIPDETKNGFGTIVMTNLQKGSETIFHYSPATVFNKNFASIKTGDKLSIYHRGIFTLSLPPQGSALEISNYKQ